MKFTTVAIAGSLTLVATSAPAAVIVHPGAAGAEHAVFVAPSDTPAVIDHFKQTGDVATTLGDTLVQKMSTLPEPSDWALLLTGFGVIGYAMRSPRQRARVSFN